MVKILKYILSILDGLVKVIYYFLFLHIFLYKTELTIYVQSDVIYCSKISMKTKSCDPLYNVPSYRADVRICVLGQ